MDEPPRPRIPEAGELLPAGHAMVLGMVAAGAPLQSTLDAVVHLLEEELDEALVSIMLSGPDGLLRLAAAPSLPQPLVAELVEGVLPGPAGMACGTAVLRLRPAIQADLARVPPLDEAIRWADAALAAGLRACWAVPVVGERSRALGAFGVYRRRSGQPAGADVQRLAGYAQMVAIAVQRDVARRQLQQVAHVDPLTGLGHPDRLLEVVDESLRRCDLASGESLTVAAVDVGRLDACNQALGHRAGDELIRHAARRIVGTVGGDAHVVRSGAATFTVIHPSPAGSDAQAMGHGLVHALAAPFTVDGIGFTADPRVGIVVCRTPTDATALLAEADRRLDAARRATTPTARVAGGRGGAAGLLAVENDLRRALVADELVVHYQPQVRLDDEVIVGLEALVRWAHPHRGLLPPAAFLPAVEHGGLQHELTAVVLRQVLADVARWRVDRPHRQVPVAVNVSAVEVRDGELVAAVARGLADAGLPGSALCIELTERDAVLDVDATAATLRDLVAMGVALALDDFGTGYSSLAHVRRFTMDQLKVDRSFVHRVDVDPDDRAVVSAVVGLGVALQRHVIAEGVETQSHRQVLREMGCETGQGFLWHPAVPAAAIEVLLAAPVDPGVA